MKKNFAFFARIYSSQPERGNDIQDIPTNSGLVLCFIDNNQSSITSEELMTDSFIFH